MSIVLGNMLQSTEPDQKLLSVMAPPPEIYFKQYTNEAVLAGTAPPPPAPPIADFTAFGINHNVCIDCTIKL